MNSNSDSDLPVELERLVDGQLSPTDYRQLLQRLDFEPDGWRRCGLAFLEQQALQQELSAVVVRPSGDASDNGFGGGGFAVVNGTVHKSRPPADGSVQSSRTLRRWYERPLGRWGSVLAVGLVVWFVVQRFQMGEPSNRLEPDSTIAIHNSSNPSTAQSNQMVQMPSIQSNESQPHRRGPEQFASVQFSDFSTGRPSILHVPLRSIQKGNQDPVSALDFDQIPDSVLNILKNRAAGFQIERGFYPIMTQDGKLVIIPYDRIQLSRFQ